MVAACVDSSNGTAALFTYVKISHRFAQWFWNHILAFFLFFFLNTVFMTKIPETGSLLSD